MSSSRAEPPYDRELIRSGGVSGARTRRDPKGQPGGGAYRPPQLRPLRGRRSGWRVIGTLLSVTLLAAVILAVVLGLRAAAFNASVSSAPFPSTALLGALNGSERVNVLMVGYGGGDHDGAYLADSIQILSIDPTTDTTTTIPIPRDLWIEGVNSFDGDGKVNEVFSVGNASGGLDAAASMLADVLSDVTGLRIEHWLSNDFAGFRDIVDAVGGVTFDNPVAFAYTMTEPQHVIGDWSTGAYDAGEIHLDGEEALAYSRARYTSVFAESNDFARSVRQARILGALRQELGEGGIASIIPGLRLMDAMEGRVRTDLSAIDLFFLSSHLSSDRRIEMTEGLVLMATTNTNGAYILIPVGWTGPGSYEALQAYLSAELSTDAP